MIQSEPEYREAINLLKQGCECLQTEEARLRLLGMSREEIKRALDPMRSFCAQLDDDVAGYERIKRGL